MANRRRNRRSIRKQLELVFRPRGGARKGAGRRPKGEAAGVSHATRESFRAEHPLHVVMKVVKGMPSLRSRRLFREVRDAIAAAAERLGMRICEFSVQSNHLHLVVEAEGKLALSRAMQGLAIRLARALQRALGRAGTIFADRYFSRVLRTPLEVKRVLAYVLENARKHGSIAGGIDPCSSGVWFDGWSLSIDSADVHEPSPLARARSWLLGRGWCRHGLIELGVSPP